MMKKGIKVFAVTGIIIFSILNVCLILIALCINGLRVRK
jgi:hypothetical protein